MALTYSLTPKKGKNTSHRTSDIKLFGSDFSLEDIVIFGASSHAKVIIDIIEKQGIYNIRGISDVSQDKGTDFYGYPILGDDEFVLRHYDIFGGIVAIGDNFIRSKVVESIKSILPDFNFIQAIHPSVPIARNVKIGNGTVIMAGCVINNDAEIGEHCIINTKSSIEHENKIGNFVHIIAGVTTGGNVRVGDYSAIGLGSTLTAGITIGKHTIIGAGSVVFSNIGDQVLVYGTPAKIIRRREINEKYLTKLDIKTLNY